MVRTVFLAVVLGFAMAPMIPQTASAVKTVPVVTEPAHGAVLASPPSDITISFGQPLLLTVFEVVTLTGIVIKTDFDRKKSVPQETVTVPLPVLEPGEYTIRWEAYGTETHAAAGSFFFTIEGE